MEAIAIKNYWDTPAKKREKIRKEAEKAEKKAQLEAYAQENRLVIYKGMAIKPENYPCACMLENPAQCQEDKNENQGKEYKNGICRCKCHMYYEPC